MHQAWRYYTLDGLARAARRHLALRGIDTFALEAARGPTPRRAHPPLQDRPGRPPPTPGLRRRRARRRRPGQPPPRRPGRGLLHPPPRPAHPGQPRPGGRPDRPGRARRQPGQIPQHPHHRHLRQEPPPLPTHPTQPPPADNLVVVEGALDALALDTYAASAGVDLTAVSPSGVALTAAHRASIYTQTASPPVLCADGDPAGREATARWVLDMTLEGRETVAVTLPHPYDPADWLAEHGIEGLHAFIRAGCLDARPSDIRPSARRAIPRRAGSRPRRPAGRKSRGARRTRRTTARRRRTKTIRPAGQSRPRSRRAWTRRLVGACCFGKARRSPPTRSAYELISSDTTRYHCDLRSSGRHHCQVEHGGRGRPRRRVPSRP